MERRGTGYRSDPYRFCQPGFVPMLQEIPELGDLYGRPRKRKDLLKAVSVAAVSY